MNLSDTLQNKKFMKGDLVVWMIFIVLCMISIAEVYSASSQMTYSSGNYWEPIRTHAIYIFVGIGITWIIHLLPCNIFKAACTLLLHFVAYPMLIYVLFAGATLNEASRWIKIAGITIQPSEIAKVCLIGFVAFVLSTLRDKNGKVSKPGYLIAGIETVLVILLIASENLSTAALIAMVMYCIAIIGRVPKKILAWIGCPIAAVAISCIIFAYKCPDSVLEELSGEKYEESILHRVPVWVKRIKASNELPPDPADYKINDENVQVTHAQIAVATCNIWGKGPGNSVQRDYLPQAFSDFIYAIIIEEGGIVVGTLVMFLYLLLLWRAMRIAQRCKHRFPAYLVMGLALMMVTQAMMNMAVAVRAMPVTGQTLPLISKGGTSTFVSCAYIGMILSVSRSAKRREPEKEKQPITVEA